MSQEKTTLEIIAPSIEEAITKGLTQLGLPREAVDVEVLDSGSRGLFGLGSRQARVRLSILSAQDQVEIVEKTSRMLIETSPVEEAFLPEAPVMESDTEVAVEEIVEGDSNALEVAQHVIEELLERMRVRATVNARYIQPQDFTRTARHPGRYPGQ